MSETVSLKALVRQARERDGQRDAERDGLDCLKIERDGARDTTQKRPFGGSYQDLATSPLAARVQAAWPWLAEHRPDLYQAVIDADEKLPRDGRGNPAAGDAGHTSALARLHEAMEAASSAWEQRQRSEAVRIYSRVLGAELWIAATEEAAQGLHREGTDLVVLLPDEAEILGRMAEVDARALLVALASIQRVIPGSRLRSVGPIADNARRMDG